MSGNLLRSFISGLILALAFSTNLPAGPLAKALGKGWDKAAEAAKAHKPKGKLLEHAKAKGNHAGAGGCCHGK